MSTRIPKAIRVGLLAFALCAATLALPSKPAAAADYNNNNMMDDAIFNEVGSMTPGEASPTVAQLTPQIQAFLSGQTITLASGQTTQLSGGSTCLANYQDTSPSWNGTVWSYGPNVSAAMIIAASAVQWGINPEVIISTLEKEESLITGGSSICNNGYAYQSAMGYACPDSGGCSSHYAGFTRQVLWGSWQLEFNEQRSYGNTAWDGDGDITYTGYMTEGARAQVAGGAVLNYNGYATIDGQTIYLDDGATAALYTYTPHLNQSFPGIFEGWFGSAILINANVVLASGLTLSETPTGYIGDTVTGSYQIQNTGGASINAGGFGVCARMNGQYYDFGFNNNLVIPGNSTVTVSYSKQLTTTGTLQAFVCSYNEALGGWDSATYPYDFTQTKARSVSITVADNPLISTGLSLSPASPAIGQPATATMSIHNAGTSAVSVGTMFVAARDPSGNNVDFPEDAHVSIAAGATYTYSQTRTFSVPGPYSLYIVNWNGGGYVTTWPDSATNSIVRQMSVTVLNNPLITTGIGLSPANPSISTPVTATLSIHNASASPVSIGSMIVAARDPSGNNVDFPEDAHVTIPASSTYTYSKTRLLTNPGKYSFFIVNWNGGGYVTNWPLSASSSIVRQTSVNVADNPLLTTGIGVSASPTHGQAVTATFTLTNSGPSAIDVGSMVIAARSATGGNFDFPLLNDVTVPANGTYTYSQSRIFPTAGQYSLFISDWKGSWSATYPTSASTSILRSTSITVN